ncbi:hypothetical protein ACX80W_02960 [Arthrobacter sp. TMN-37]
MTMGETSRAAAREALGQGIAGTALALLSIVSFQSADTWYSILGSSVIAAGAAAFVARAILALRTGQHTTPTP